MSQLPDLIQPMSYEEILQDAVTRVKTLLPGYTPAQGDDIMLVLQSFAYRELLLREYIQSMVEGNFLSTATGAMLDHLAETRYGLYRLHGSRPYATATFSLSTALDYDVNIPAGYQLTEDGGVHFSHTTRAATISAGDLSVDVAIELEHETASSSVRTEIPVTPLPYLSVTQTGDFDHGGDLESDEEFKERIRTSLADKSTAGSEATYISYALRSDERIEDVFVYSPAPGVVRVVYYSSTMDAIMQERLTYALNDREVRPLTDNVEIQAATVVDVPVQATLVLNRGADAAVVLQDAIAALEALSTSPQIGRDIHTSQIIAALMVSGVERVDLATPTDSVTIAAEQIGVISNSGISTQESSDVY